MERFYIEKPRWGEHNMFNRDTKSSDAVTLSEAMGTANETPVEPETPATVDTGADSASVGATTDEKEVERDV